MKTADTTTAAKKQWQKPNFYILDSINAHSTAKAQNSHHEGSMQLSGTPGYGSIGGIQGFYIKSFIS